ncbi:lamin tail domain-containing protein [Candidatus Wolfebacteria bacterium]|nr:lamin tail domain-containing protein [Candidatus Wolfebacteria bacterium]
MRSTILAAIFLGIIGLVGFGIYLGMDNFSNNNFANFIGSVELSKTNSENQIVDTTKQAEAFAKPKAVKKIPEAKILVSTSTFNQAASLSQILEPALTQASSAQIQAVSNQPDPIQSAQGVDQAQISNPPSQTGKIIISEIMAGSDASVNYEFIELYNPNSFAIDLTGWSIKKISSSGSESTLVSNNTKGNFKDKKIMSNKYLLLANKDGYNGIVQPDIFYSSALAYKNNAIVIYDKNGNKIEELGWQEIPKNKSYERASFESNQFNLRPNPNPQNSQSN